VNLLGYWTGSRLNLRPVPAISDPLLPLLVIDDDNGSLELLSSALRQDDVRILTAQDPVQGLALVHEYHPKIVITDLVMPNMNGLEVLDRIMETDPSISVILMTAYGSVAKSGRGSGKDPCRSPRRIRSKDAIIRAR